MDSKLIIDRLTINCWSLQSHCRGKATTIWLSFHSDRLFLATLCTTVVGLTSLTPRWGPHPINNQSPLFVMRHFLYWNHFVANSFISQGVVRSLYGVITIYWSEQTDWDKVWSLSWLSKKLKASIEKHFDGYNSHFNSSFDFRLASN